MFPTHTPNPAVGIWEGKIREQGWDCLALTCRVIDLPKEALSVTRGGPGCMPPIPAVRVQGMLRSLGPDAQGWCEGYWPGRVSAGVCRVPAANCNHPFPTGLVGQMELAIRAHHETINIDVRESPGPTNSKGLAWQ